MKKIVRNITIKAFAYFMIGIMSILVVNKAMFMHAHKMTDGKVITHSHPYDKNDSKPFKSHHHTKVEFLVIENLKILFLFVFLTSTLQNLVKKAKYSFYRITRYTLNCIILYKSRAPPIS
jgi:hypothetical protein